MSTRTRQCWAAKLLWLLAVSPAAAQPSPPPAAVPVIREIVYEGNNVTRPVTMDRELAIRPGDVADEALIERSRQGIQDLGLFREVKARQEPADDGGVRVIFSVREKWYLIPIPRLEVNADGDTGYGLQLRWNNVWGLNHRWELLAVQRDFKREDKDDSTNISTNYNIPFLRGSPYALNLALNYNEQDSTNDAGISYREDSQRLAVAVSRRFDGGTTSQGWRGGLGLAWMRQDTTGLSAPDPYGTAVSPSVNLSYRNVRDYVYSETGRSFGSSVAFAADGALSDYGFFTHYTHYSDERAIGTREHQTLRFTAEFAGYYDGPDSRDPGAFEYGGSERLRGYDREVIDGDVAYYAAVDFLRPVRWNWMRMLATLEAGSALDSFNEPNGKLLYASVGLGVTMRVTWLVNVEFEAGVAYPLIEGDGLRFFARSL